MAINTSNYNLKRPSPEDFYNIEDQNGNMDIIDAELNKLNENKASVEHNHNGEYETPEGAQSKADAAKSSANQYTDQKFTMVNSGLSSHLSDYVRQPGYAVTTGSANTYVAALIPAPTAYTDGMGIVVKINAANTGAATVNVNGLGAKAIVDSKGNALVAGKLRLNGTYSLKYNSTSGNFILQGEGGEYGTAGATQVLSGFTVGTDSGLVSGTIPSKSAATITPSASVQTIAAGQYLSGIQTISAVTVPAASVLAGTTIAGTAGTMPNRAGDTAALANSVSGTTLKLRPSDGYRDGVDDNVTITDANFVADNIVNGKSIFGLQGSYSGVQIQIIENIQSSNYNYKMSFCAPDGTDLNDYDGTPYALPYLTVSGLTKKPSIIILLNNSYGMNYRFTTIYHCKAIYNSIYGPGYVFASSPTGQFFHVGVDGSRCYVTNTGFRVPVGLYDSNTIFRVELYYF